MSVIVRITRVMVSAGLVLVMSSGLFVAVVSAGETREDVGVEQNESFLGDALLAEQQTDSVKTSGELKLPGFGEVLFKMFMFLAVVIAMIYVAMFFMKKYTKAAVPEKDPTQDAIRVLGYRKLDVKRGIYLIEVLGKVLVVAADYEGLKLLTEISDPAQIDQARQLTAVKPDLFAFNPFQSMLDAFTVHYQKEGRSPGRAPGAGVGRRDLSGKVNQLKGKIQP